ncbi:MAG: FMN-binding negative transcriptional regulator [Candidatus Andeanibacterium colombiense]|uniref:FMN-binding negative transcriptional regulator n=1 Tax=Candidatus Andeanibacterium colombiense TaxID=3121345 RepID=A0AAJ5X9G2_9SPHN|nr:MAG: FMN-binding negative transcriptional regulator [Sphingomonadaceae bacterium]
MDFPSGKADDLADLIRAYPLAWLVTCGSSGFDATPLPLIAETDEAGEVVALIGHCSRRNAQVAALRKHPFAFALFMGPQGYISPALVSNPKWVPTWNFAVAVLALEVALDDDGTEEAVRRLTEQVEAGQPEPWRMEQAGERIGALMTRIIGFRARVLAKDVRLKLGQEEDAATAAEIIAGLADSDLAQWMGRMNRDRTEPAANLHAQGHTAAANQVSASAGIDG